MYASNSEATFAQWLTEAYLKFDFEPFSLTLAPAFIFQGKKVQDWEYTPDFLVTSPKGNKFLVEIKGRITERWRLTAKMAKLYMYNNPPEYEYIIVSSSLTDMKATFTKILNN